VDVVDTAHLVDLHDVAVHQGRRRPSFLHEPLDRTFTVAMDRFPEHLHRHLSAERRLQPQVHIGHRTASEKRAKLVAAEPVARRKAACS
jgi:hypothetical protein